MEVLTECKFIFLCATCTARLAGPTGSQAKRDHDETETKLNRVFPALALLRRFLTRAGFVENFLPFIGRFEASKFPRESMT
jgi:hypothetical protein